jgi:Thymidylate kinase
MHISIEGMDGVGKTTIAKRIAEALDYTFVEKPLHHLFDSEFEYSNYLRIRDYINKQTDRVLSSWFYGLGNLYLYHKYDNQNIVTDRHLLSNYGWSGTIESEPVFDLLIEQLGSPNFTFILYADEIEIKNRLLKRNSCDVDNDIQKIEYVSTFYPKIESFCLKHGIHYKFIDSTKLAEDDIVKIILIHIKEYENVQP